MLSSVNSDSSHSGYLSPSGLLDLELTVINEAVDELQHAMNETPQAPNASLITLIMPVLAQQTEVVRDRNLLSDQPLERVWADRSLSVQERAFFFQHSRLFFHRISPRGIDPCPESVRFLKAAARIGDDSDVLSQMVHVTRFVGEYEVDHLIGVGLTIDAFADVRQNHPNLYPQVLRFVEMFISEGRGMVKGSSVVQFIEAITAALIRGDDIEEMKRESGALGKAFGITR